MSAEHMNVVYLGVPDPFHELIYTPRECMALTVGKVDWPNLQRKGLEPFVRTAAYLPEVQFVLVGAWADDSIEYLRSIASPNVLFTGRVSSEELFDWYRRASVYMQASLHEGFGLSVAEAMLAGCVPVVTRRGSLPEVVGNQGFYCGSPEPGDLAQAVKAALDSSPLLRVCARDRILNLFSMPQRKRSLELLVYGACNNHAKE